MFSDANITLLASTKSISVTTDIGNPLPTWPGSILLQCRHSACLKCIPDRATVCIDSTRRPDQLTQSGLFPRGGGGGVSRGRGRGGGEGAVPDILCVIHAVRRTGVGGIIDNDGVAGSARVKPYALESTSFPCSITPETVPL